MKTTRIEKEADYGDKSYHAVPCVGLSEQAKMAFHLAEKLGMAAAKQDGEDSAGRQKLKLLTPEEVAERAISIVEHLWVAFQVKDWILPIPEIERRSTETASTAKTIAVST
jgi:hypothetical protein